MFLFCLQRINEKNAVVTSTSEEFIVDQTSFLVQVVEVSTCIFYLKALNQ